MTTFVAVASEAFCINSRSVVHSPAYLASILSTSALVLTVTAACVSNHTLSEDVDLPSSLALDPIVSFCNRARSAMMSQDVERSRTLVHVCQLMATIVYRSLVEAKRFGVRVDVKADAAWPFRNEKKMVEDDWMVA